MLGEIWEWLFRRQTCRDRLHHIYELQDCRQHLARQRDAIQHALADRLAELLAERDAHTVTLAKLAHADTENARLNRELETALAHATELAGYLDRASADLDTHKAMLLSAMERIGKLSHMVTRLVSQGRHPDAARVAELEAAIAPFAAVLVDGWDRGELPADALYPVPMGDVRRLARAMAGVGVGAKAGVATPGTSEAA